MGAPDKDGYGQFHDGKRNTRPHRFAYEIVHGQIPAGLVVRHKCDNPACVNPDHLHLGTQQQNIDDRTEKRRHRFGFKHYRSKLTEDDIFVTMARLLREGFSNRVIARELGVSDDLICKILKGKCRLDLKDKIAAMIRATPEGEREDGRMWRRTETGWQSFVRRPWVAQKIAEGWR